MNTPQQAQEYAFTRVSAQGLFGRFDIAKAWEEGFKTALLKPEGKLPFTLDESDRQMLLLALAELSLSRPGWYYATGLVVDKLVGRDAFEAYRKTSSCPTCGCKLPPFAALK